MAGYFKTVEDRQKALEARVNALEVKVDMFIREHEQCKRVGLSDEQRGILLAENMTVREKAKRLGKSKSWVSKWVSRFR